MLTLGDVGSARRFEATFAANETRHRERLQQWSQRQAEWAAQAEAARQAWTTDQEAEVSKLEDKLKEEEASLTQQAEEEAAQETTDVGGGGGGGGEGGDSAHYESSHRPIRMHVACQHSALKALIHYAVLVCFSAMMLG
jgi:HK97 family phage major capsid protein